MRGPEVRGTSATGAFLGNPLNHADTVCRKVLMGNMGVNPNFCTLRRLTILLKEEVECCIVVKLEEGQSVVRPKRAAGHTKGVSDKVKSKHIGMTQSLLDWVHFL